MLMIQVTNGVLISVLAHLLVQVLLKWRHFAECLTAVLTPAIIIQDWTFNTRAIHCLNVKRFLSKFYKCFLVSNTCECKFRYLLIAVNIPQNGYLLPSTSIHPGTCSQEPIFLLILNRLQMFNFSCLFIFTIPFLLRVVNQIFS